MNAMRHRAGAALGIALLLLAPGCGRHQTLLAPDSSPPVLVLDARPAPTADAGLARHRVDFELESGTATRYLYALNPRSETTVDESWSSTTQPGITVDAPLHGPAPGAEIATRVVVLAVDGLGRRSEPARLTFLGDNIAPAVRIVSPVPSDRWRAYLPPIADIRWQGVDPDGEPLPIPAIFKWKLIGPGSEFPFQVALTFPDSVRRRYEPGGYADWDSMSSRSSGEGAITLRGLQPGENYMFVVVARDARGAWSREFTQDSNMLNFRCLAAGSAGPLLTIYNESFYYAYPAPSYSTDPRHEIRYEVPSGRRFAIRWFATPLPGTEIAGYRWALDLESAAESAQEQALRGRRHRWSPLRRDLTEVELGPFGPGEVHRLYVEAQDLHGFRSLGVVRIESIQHRARRPLLIVDDTRYSVDHRSGSNICMNPPLGRWPSAAELDSFLYARGGAPWRCYPAGTSSTPGLFAGYDFDTLGTRGIPGGVVPLASLGRYERVIWLTDPNGAINISPPFNLAQAIGALRLMTRPGGQNSLAEYVRSGGRLWVAGGGIAYASLIEYNRPGNDGVPPAGGVTFSNALGELVPGRFPYDLGGWRSEIKVVYAPVAITRYLGRFEGRGSVYEGLPAAMQPRSALTDPYPPGRTFQPANFYLTNFALEYLSRPNPVTDHDFDKRPGHRRSPLDTLYRATGSVLMPSDLNPHNVAMTRFDAGIGRSPVIFTGFDLWNFRRSDCKEMVDFVLQRLWGMHPAAESRLARAEP